MSQGFNLHYTRMKEGETPLSANSNDSNAIENNTSIVGGSSRNICFVIDPNRMIFLSYAYLISGEYKPDENTITLLFTSHSVTIKGIKLEALFYRLMDHAVKQIMAVDSRYNALQEGSELVVNRIMIEDIKV
jgi:hypothetical protein